MPHLVERFTELFVADALALLFTASVRDQIRFLYSVPMIFNDIYAYDGDMLWAMIIGCNFAV